MTVTRASAARTARTAVGFLIVGVTGLAVNQALFWLMADITHLWISLAAIVATQGSTAWNFVLTDRVIYRDHPQSGHWYVRFIKSWVVNNAFLLVRIPLLLVLAHGGMNHLWANLVTIGVLFAFRFWISDRFIWETKKIVAEVTGEPAERPTTAAVLVEMKTPAWGPHMVLNLRARRWGRTYHYNIHGLVTILSEVSLPELSYFRTEVGPKNADITIRRGYVGNRGMLRRVRATKLPGSFVYQEHLGSIGANFRVDLNDRVKVTVSPLLASSKHVVYTNVVEALLRFVLVNKGWMLLHSATVLLEGKTIMLSAETDTGKTGTILRLMREHPKTSGFLSDDMTIINASGEARCFPKPLTISSHTLRAVNTKALPLHLRAALAIQSRIHSKDGRQFALLLARLNLPIIAINALAQILIPPPKYMIDRLVPTVKYKKRGKVSQIFVIGRGESLDEPMHHDEAVKTLLANTEDAYGFPPFGTMEQAITLRKKELRRGKKQDIRELRMRERDILEAFLGTTPVTRLISPDFGWADIIPARVHASSIDESALTSSSTAPVDLAFAVVRAGRIPDERNREHLQAVREVEPSVIDDLGRTGA